MKKNNKKPIASVLTVIIIVLFTVGTIIMWNMVMQGLKDIQKSMGLGVYTGPLILLAVVVMLIWILSRIVRSRGTSVGKITRKILKID